MKIDVTKDKLRNATRKLMSECGSPLEVTSRSIAKEAGVGNGNVKYRIFGSTSTKNSAIKVQLFRQ